MVLLFALTLFVSATLLFLVEPMFAKMAQDSFDGKVLGQQILTAVFKAAIGVALTAITF